MPRDRGTQRKYLPYGLTKEEKENKSVRQRLSNCIRKLEKKYCPKSALRRSGGRVYYDYNKCRYNPVAVCRASVEGLRQCPKGQVMKGGVCRPKKR